MALQVHGCVQIVFEGYLQDQSILVPRTIQEDNESVVVWEVVEAGSELCSMIPFDSG